MNARIVLAFLLLTPAAAVAQDILVIGEVHDNPAHHLVQAGEVSALKPAALVFEMLTPKQARGKVLAEVEDAAALEQALGWDATGWPNFAMYHPIFAAAPEARVYGAGVPSDEAKQALDGQIGVVFGSAASAFGLTSDLPREEQEAREALQFTAHCEAIPEEMLPGMVDIQRLRDASLARTALRAHGATGGPVAVITGNGHARPDWGVPAYLARVAPELEVKVIGQTEDDAPLDGGFETVLSSPAVDRPDPCDAFK